MCEVYGYINFGEQEVDKELTELNRVIRNSQKGTQLLLVHPYQQSI